MWLLIEGGVYSIDAVYVCAVYTRAATKQGPLFEEIRLYIGIYQVKANCTMYMKSSNMQLPNTNNYNIISFCVENYIPKSFPGLKRYLYYITLHYSFTSLLS